MDHSNIKGYKKLSEGAKRVFDYVYRKHQNGVEEKEAWTAVAVKQRETYIRVTFKNGEWLSYYPDGKWC